MRPDDGCPRARRGDTVRDGQYVNNYLSGWEVGGPCGRIGAVHVGGVDSGPFRVFRRIRRLLPTKAEDSFCAGGARGDDGFDSRRFAHRNHEQS